MSKTDGQYDVHCYHCGRRMTVGRRAQSTSCPGCSRRVVIEDIVVRTYHAVVNAETCGKLIVAKGGHVVVQKRIVAFKGIEVEGKLQCREAISAGPVLLGPKAEWKGNLRAAALAVKSGGSIQAGHFIIPADVLADYPKG
jgi:hypothetical protein